MEVSPNYALHTQNNRVNNPLLPNNLRLLICGKSGSGKTIVLLNLLLNEGWLDWNKLFVFGKSLFQEEYEMLRKGIESGMTKKELRNLFQKSPGSDYEKLSCQFFTEPETIPDPSELSPEDKNIFVFDDVLQCTQEKPAAYFTRSRHSNCDCIYISQNYFKVERGSVRENCNVIILFPQDQKNLLHIYGDHASSDISFPEFKQFCKRVWSTKRNFVVIDLTSTVENGKFRRNFKDFYFPDELEQQISEGTA